MLLLVSERYLKRERLRITRCRLDGLDIRQRKQAVLDAREPPLAVFLQDKCMRPEATSVCGVDLLAYEALS
jgi:hypothetical protein